MPKAARARVASPPAGTALARAIRDCLPNRVRLGRDSTVYVAQSVTNVNFSVTIFCTVCLKEAADGRDAQPCLSTGDEAGDDIRRWTPHYL